MRRVGPAISKGLYHKREKGAVRRFPFQRGRDVPWSRQAAALGGTRVGGKAADFAEGANSALQATDRHTRSGAIGRGAGIAYYGSLRRDLATWRCA